MVPDPGEALGRLRERLGSRAASLWLRGATVKRTHGKTILRVARPFEKSRLETRYAQELAEVFGEPVEVVAETAPRPVPPPAPRPAVPRLTGPRGELAKRMVRDFATGEPVAATLLVLHGPPRSGKSLLAEWAARLAGTRAFRLDLARVRAGRSRGLVPRKPLTVAAGVEVLAGRGTAQRTLCTILDAVQDRGDRVLLTLEGHPTRPDLTPALRSRLVGGILVAVEGQEASSRAPAGPEPLLHGMKDRAARLFDVDRSLLDGTCKRRSVVEVRRTIMAAAARAGLPPERIAKAFGLRSCRPVAEACRWAAREEARDQRYASALDEVARVAPRA